jgi:DNA-binding PadR family transcriptional regulator
VYPYYYYRPRPAAAGRGFAPAPGPQSDPQAPPQAPWAGPIPPLRPRGRGRAGRQQGRARRGQLRESILFLLAERDRNGYQIMAELAERTMGAWAPSAGAVYPALSQLTREGLIEQADADGQRVFQLTNEGKEAASAIKQEPWAEHSLKAANQAEIDALYREFHQLGQVVRTAAASAVGVQLSILTELVAGLRRSISSVLAGEEPSQAADDAMADDEVVVDAPFTVDEETEFSADETPEGFEPTGSSDTSADDHSAE